MENVARQSLVFPASLASLVDIREAVRSAVAATGASGDDLARVVTVAHELAANAVEHSAAAESIEVTISVEPDAVLLAVSAPDEGRTPVMREPSEEGERGRGLLIVDALSDCWKSERANATQTVSARVPLAV
ncbi:MAG TPA: ATP-binding protein [Gaiellaceae bacterium]|nr:ATP-binding protein [Gaiellaceae bacterium]